MFSLSSLSRRVLASCSRSTGTPLPGIPQSGNDLPTALSNLSLFTRGRAQLAPKKIHHIKRHKGRVPIPIGGSTKGTTLAYGQWGIRIKGNGVRITAKQLTTVEETLKKKLKIIKGVKVYLRVFPDIPVCIKGNETRMGKGKGTFEYWATRVPTGRVLFEIGGAPIREDFARDAFRIAASKLPTTMEFIGQSTPPRLGNLVLHPPKPVNTSDSTTTPELDLLSSSTSQGTTSVDAPSP